MQFLDGSVAGFRDVGEGVGGVRVTIALPQLYQSIGSCLGFELAEALGLRPDLEHDSYLPKCIYGGFINDLSMVGADTWGR